jgi:hypothetical protein
MNHYKH